MGGVDRVSGSSDVRCVCMLMCVCVRVSQIHTCSLDDSIRSHEDACVLLCRDKGTGHKRIADEMNAWAE